MFGVDELLDQASKIEELGNPVVEFLVSDEFTSVDPNSVDPVEVTEDS